MNIKQQTTDEELTTKQICTHCGANKYLYEFYRSGTSHETTCRECRNLGIPLRRKPKVEELTTKVCKACSKIKNRAEFYREKDSPDGREDRCIECRNSKKLIPRELKRKPPRKPTADDQKTKICKACGKIKTCAEFYPLKKSPDGREARCRECREYGKLIPKLPVPIKQRTEPPILVSPITETTLPFIPIEPFKLETTRRIYHKLPIVSGIKTKNGVETRCHRCDTIINC